jgi:hypothetical protein
MKGRLQRSLPLLVLATIELLWCSYLLFSRRVPLGHDGFQYFYLKFYFFNDFVQNGELAQWFPYLTHGSPSSWWYVVQSGMFDAAGMLISRALQIKDFFPIFYTLLLAEKLLFLLGMWLLASQHYRSRISVFVATAAMTTTSIWYTQPWWNFHAVVALPLLLFLVYKTIFNFRWRWLCSAALLFFLQTFGHLSYYLPMTLLFLIAYVIVLMLTHSDAMTALRSQFRFSAAGAVFLLMVLIALLVVMFWLQQSSSDISFGASSRNADGGVSLKIFLTYAGNTDLRSWNQLMSGLTPHLDFTMFAGFLVFGLLMLTVTEKQLNPNQKLFAWLTVGAGLLAAASPLSTLVYYLWPLGRYFRHLVLLQPVTKLFCILLAGSTLDRLIHSPSPFRKARVYGFTAIMLPCAVFLGILAFSADQRALFLDALKTVELPLHPGYPASAGRLEWCLFALVMTWIFLVQLLRHFDKPESLRRIAWMAALLLLVDLSFYHRTEMRARTQKLSVAEASIFRFAPLPYVEQRPDTPQTANNARLGNWQRPLSKAIGEEYWSQDLLWMIDSYQTGTRTVFWSESLQELLKARWPDSEKQGERLSPPITDKLLTRFGGREGKVLFSTQAIACPDAASSATLLADARYDGAIPLITTSAQNIGLSTLPCDLSAVTAAPAATPRASAKIMAFHSNGAVFEIENSSETPVLMTYSDVWSRFWSAEVNGGSAPVLRTALAYKSVVVPPGRSVVQFKFQDRQEILVFGLQTAATLLFVVFLAWLISWSMAERAVVASKEPGSES